MNLNNKHFQIKNSHFHFHSWKKEFTYETTTITKEFYKCSKCPEVIAKLKGFVLGCFREKTVVSSIEIMETCKKLQELKGSMEEERKEWEKEEKKENPLFNEENCTCVLKWKDVTRLNTNQYKLCDSCKMTVLRLLEDDGREEKNFPT